MIKINPILAELLKEAAQLDTEEQKEVLEFTKWLKEETNNNNKDDEIQCS